MRKGVIMRKKWIYVLVVFGVFIALIVPSLAGGMNYARAWETLLGSRWNGYVQIQACYDDNGLHAKRGYHRFMRDAGPSLDTGRMYTSQATSPYDCEVRWRQDSVWDSPLWGDRYTTRYYYGFDWW